MTTDELMEAVRLYAAERYPLAPAVRVSIRLADGEKLRLPMPCCPIKPEAASAVFVPTTFQESILDALEGKALRTDALGVKVGDRSRLFRKPGGLPELREQGYVDHHPRLGYYRPDAPPDELRPAETPDTPAISRTERRILETVAKLDADDPTGEEIAAAAKLPYQPHLKKTLAAMRAKGLLGGRKGEVGYPITPEGLAAIEPIQGKT